MTQAAVAFGWYHIFTLSWKPCKIRRFLTIFLEITSMKSKFNLLSGDRSGDKKLTNHLDWTSQSLYNKSETELCEKFGSIGKNEHSLDLSWNLLCRILPALSKAIPYLPENVVYLDLGKNDLGKDCSIDHLVEFLKQLPKHLQGLRITQNFLYMISDEDLQQVIKAIEVEDLDLGVNGFGLHAECHKHLAYALPALNERVKTLRLGWNNFYHLSGFEMASLLSSIPSHVNTLDFRTNNLELMPLEAMKALANAAPHINTLFLSHYEALNMSAEQAQCLINAFPNLQNIITINKYNQERSFDAQGFLKHAHELKPDLQAGSSLFFKPADEQEKRDIPAISNQQGY